MWKIILYVLSFFGLLAIMLITWLMLEDAINDIREAKLKKKERSATLKVAGRIDSMHYWFSAMPQAFNVLFFTQYYLKKYGYVNAERIREAVIKLGDKKYCDVPEEELNDLLKC